MDAAEEMVNVIRDVIQQELSKKGQTILCQVVNKTDDKHYDVYVVPDESEVVKNVLNTTRFDFKEGDYVYIYKINNQLNNSFIMSAVDPYVGTDAPRVYHDTTQVTIEPVSVLYEASTKRWFLQINDDSLYNALCNDGSHIIAAIYRHHSKKQAYRLETGVSRPYDDQRGSVYIDRLQYTMAASLNSAHVESIDLQHSFGRKIDVTHIIQEYIYYDNYVLNESDIATTNTYRTEGAWWKKFGLCIYSGQHGKYWHTPHDKMYTVWVHIEPESGEQPNPSLTVVDTTRRSIMVYS